MQSLKSDWLELVLFVVKKTCFMFNYNKFLYLLTSHWNKKSFLVTLRLSPFFGQVSKLSQTRRVHAFTRAT